MGIGRSMALRLADLGCNIAVADVNMVAAEKTVDELKSKGVKAIAYKCDVTKLEDVEKLRDDVINDYGTVEILVISSPIFVTRN